MTIITEGQEPAAQRSKPTPSRKTPHNLPSASPSPTTRHNPFTFWFYFTLVVSLITLLFVSLSVLSPEDPKTWFLSLPTNLRSHYSKGRSIKVQITPNIPPIEVFTIQDGPVKSDNVLFVHGLGCSSYTFGKIVEFLGLKGLHAVAIDLPGSGFSDKSFVVMEESSGGGLGRVRNIYNEIKEKGLFWGFDQLIGQGYVNYEENDIRLGGREIAKAIELGPEEMGRVLGQVVDSMGLAPVDLVLHDSALGLGANWVLKNPGLVRSITLLDTTSSSTAFPLWVLQIPVVRELVLGFRFVFMRVLKLCCSKSVGIGLDVEAHRILLKGRDGRRSVVGMGKKMNYSFDLVEWGSSEGVKGLPTQVVWSRDWSNEWSKEGHRVVSALPLASFVTHSGGRWPQDDATDVAESILKFLSTLPKSVRKNEMEPIRDHIGKMTDESGGSDHHHPYPHHDHEQDHGHDHNHGDTTDFMDAYGLGHRWAT